MTILKKTFIQYPVIMKTYNLCIIYSHPAIIAPTYWLFFNADNIDESDDVNSNNCDNNNYDNAGNIDYDTYFDM